jgi:hypothetical protein
LDNKITKMKKVLILFAAVIVVLVFNSMQTENKAEFKFEKETHDFGQIPQGKPVSAEFTFTNTGGEQLIISSIETSCDCIMTKFTREPILKGGKGIVTITYNAAKPQAGFIRAVRIKSNARTPIKVLYIKGEVRSAG